LGSGSIIIEGLSAEDVKAAEKTITSKLRALSEGRLSLSCASPAQARFFTMKNCREHLKFTEVCVVPSVFLLALFFFLI
jgi:hypothetical protein